MERKEILIVIAAVLAVCVLIAGIRAVRGEDEGSTPDYDNPPPVSDIVITGGATNYWDYLHAQSETTTTTASTELNGGEQMSQPNESAPEQTDVTSEAAQTETTGTVSLPAGAFIVQTSQGSAVFTSTSSTTAATASSTSSSISVYIIPVH